MKSTLSIASNRSLHGSSRRLVRALVVLAVVALSLSISGCRRARLWRLRRTMARVETAQAIAREANGHAAYLRYCALCHRADAQGYAADHANAIGNPVFLSIATDAFLRESIVDGRPGTPMSPWGRSHGGPLDEATVGDIVFYLRSLARLPPVTLTMQHVYGSADNGHAIWNQRCVSCHGPTGAGTAVSASLSHPYFQRSATDMFLLYTIAHGRAGTPMPPFESLGPQALNDLVAFVRTLGRAPNQPATFAFEPPPSLDHLIMNPQGHAPTFTLRDDRFVPAADVVHALEQHRRIVILDARPPSDWARGHIPGALPFPFYNIEEMATRLPRDGTWILAYCACPHAASGHVVDELRRRQFPHTAIIDEGILFWMSHGYPTAQAAPAPATPTAPGTPAAPVMPLIPH